MRAMATRRALRSEAGFTIQELLVAIVAGSMMVGFSYSLYLFVDRIVQKDMGRSEHRARALKAVELIASDVGEASVIEQVTDTTLTLVIGTGRSISYMTTQGVVLRNELTLGPREGEVWSLHFQSGSVGEEVLILLKSNWGKDSLQAHVEVHIPQSSAVKFTAKAEERNNSSRDSHPVMQ